MGGRRGAGQGRERGLQECSDGGGYIIINQVRKPQCFVVGFEGSLSLSLSLSLEGVSLSTVVGQACFVRQ